MICIKQWNEKYIYKDGSLALFYFSFNEILSINSQEYLSSKTFSRTVWSLYGFQFMWMLNELRDKNVILYKGCVILTNQGLARLSKKSWSGQPLLSFLGLDNPKFSSLKDSRSWQLKNSGSQIVSVSTTQILHSLKKSKYCVIVSILILVCYLLI